MKYGQSTPAISLWKLERYLLGELPPAEIDRIGGLLAKDAVLADRFKALEAEYADLQAAHPTGRMAGGVWNKLREKVPERARSKPGKRLAGYFPALIPALAVLLLLVFLPGPFHSILSEGSGRSHQSIVGEEDQGGNRDAEGTKGTGGTRVNRGGNVPPGNRNDTPPIGTEATRLKGSRPGLYLFRKAGGGAEALPSGGKVHAGDLIQVFYEAAGRTYGAVFSVDGNGKVTWHLPESGNRAALLSPSGMIPLASAFELDATPGREVFHFLAADHPFALDTSLTALATDSSGKPSPASGLSHSAFPLTKESP